MAKRVIDLANPGGWIAREVLFAFRNMTPWGDSVTRQYTDEFKTVGEKVIIRKEVQFDAIDGEDTGGSIEGNIQELDERNAVLVVNHNPIVPFQITDRDMALSISEFRTRYIIPAARKLVNKVEQALAQDALKFSNMVGEPGVTPDNFDALAAAAEVLDYMSVPRDGDRSCLINPKANRKLTANLTDKLNPASDVEKARHAGLLGDTASFNVKMTQIGATHRDGVQDGTGQVSGGDQTGGTINLKGFTPGDVLTKNGIISFDGVESVNRFTKDTNGILMQFRVTATATADGSGNMAVTIEPPIEIEGPYQNVTAAPLNNAAVNVDSYGESGPTISHCNFAFHKNAMAIAAIPLEQPKGFDISVVVKFDGWILRFLRGFDIQTGKFISRMEILFASDCLEPTAGVRING